jgi:hypothetical protein
MWVAKPSLNSPKPRPQRNRPQPETRALLLLLLQALPFAISESGFFRPAA